MVIMYRFELYVFVPREIERSTVPSCTDVMDRFTKLVSSTFQPLAGEHSLSQVFRGLAPRYIRPGCFACAQGVLVPDQASDAHLNAAPRLRLGGYAS